MTKLAPHPGAAAVARAKSYVGKAAYSGMCQAFTVTMFGTGGVGDYDGDRDADAVDGWKKAKAKGQVVTADTIKDYTAIPPGVALYWSGGSRGYGHAAVSIGGGQMVTTDRSGGRIGTAAIKGWWASTHTFLGYVLIDGNGYTLTDTITDPLEEVIMSWYKNKEEFEQAVADAVLGRDKVKIEPPGPIVIANIDKNPTWQLRSVLTNILKGVMDLQGRVTKLDGGDAGKA